ncbi:MAG: methyltransferase domain-containing protein, partial [Acidimicrobiales bacterium]
MAANLAVLELLGTLRHEGRPAHPDEQVVLARWSGWGSLPQLFDEDNDTYATQRARARQLLGDEDAWAAARRTTLNAHYTSAEVVGAMWRTVGELGFAGGRVLEPGCGSGNFLGLAPEGCDLTGVEADPTTAAIARHLYGARAIIRHARFEALVVPDGHFDLVIGNVPFAKLTPHDPRHNRSRQALHNYFIIKSLHLTRPGGLVAVLTSRYTIDARNPGARREIDELADLVGAVRFPAGAFSQSSGTEVVCDLLVLRRREAGAEHRGPAWTNTVAAPVEAAGESLFVNEHLVAHPQFVLGRLGVHRGMYREKELTVEATGPLGPAMDAAFGHLVDEARSAGLTMTPGATTEEPLVVRTPVPAEAGAFTQEGSFAIDSGRLVRV